MQSSALCICFIFKILPGCLDGTLHGGSSRCPFCKPLLHTGLQGDRIVDILVKLIGTLPEFIL